MLILTGNVVNAVAEDKQILKLALKQQRELRLAISIDVSILLAGWRAVGGGGRLFMHRHLFIFQFPATSSRGTWAIICMVGQSCSIEG